MLPPERRLGDVLALIEDQRFFTLHAGRQMPDRRSTARASGAPSWPVLRPEPEQLL